MEGFNMKIEVRSQSEDEIGFYRSSPVAKQIEEYNKAKDNKANTEE